MNQCKGIRPYLERMGKSVSFELWQDPQVPLQFQFETGFLLRGDGDPSIPFQMKQGNRPSSRVEEGKTALFLSLAGKSAFLSSGDMYPRNLLGFHKGCQVPFQVPRGNVGFLGKRCSVKGPPLAWSREFHGFCWGVLGSLGFLSSCMGT